MSEQPAIQRPARDGRSRDPVRDGLIVLCMTVVAMALGIGLHLQFAMAFWLAVVAALSVYVALLSAHVLVRRSEHIDALRREVSRLEARGGRPSGTAAAAAPQAMPASAAAAGRPQRPVASAAASLDDYWKFTPGNGAPATPLVAAAGTGAAAVGAAPRGGTVRPRDSEAEQIDAVIKKLAADITQGQAVLGREAALKASQAAATEAGRVAAPTAAERPNVGEERPTRVRHSTAGVPQSATDTPAAPVMMPDVDESVAALHAAADAMREAGRAFDQQRAEPDRSVASRIAPPPLPRAAVGVAPLDPARAHLAAVAEALERERFDVMLQPILGLADRRAQHYVVSIRLRGGLDHGLGGNGAGLSGDQFAAGSGVLPLLDAVKVESAARVAWRMEDRGKPGALFSQLSSESLVSDRFLNRFADTYRQGETLGGRLVLSFRQAEVRVFSELQWATLRDMSDLGFRFCLDDITDLDLDFEALGAAGFTFARLDAAVFFDGLQAEGGVIPAGDICRHFAELELAVIVGEIADEAVSARLQSFGVTLGVGDLYGVPRPVKADVLRNPHAAVA